MVLNLINIINVGIIWVLLFPHIIKAVHSSEGEVSCRSKILNSAAQIGRYASMLLMVLPVGVWKFGFPSDVNMIIYFALNILLLAAYIIAWVIRFKKQSFGMEIAVVLLEAAVFFNCGICLEHWFLVGSSAVFAVGTVAVLLKHKKEEESCD